MNKNRFAFGAIVLAAGIAGGAAACGGGGGGGGSGTVMGTLGGDTVKVSDTISAKLSQGSGSNMQTFGVVFMSNIDGLCAEASSMSNVNKKNAVGVIIQAFNFDSATQAVTAPTAAGTYTVFVNDGQHLPGAMAASVQTLATDAACASVAAKESSSVSGTVTLTSVSGDVFKGSYDVMLENGDHLTGTFNPEACPALNNSGSDGSGSGSGSAVCE